MAVEKVIILGSGPAGLTAALYAARGNLSPVLISGNEIGGQIATTTEVENFPGFPGGLTGPELTEKMWEQAEHFGTRYIHGEVTEVDFQHSPFAIRTHDEEYLAHSVIIATGASPRKLNVPGEQEMVGRGVSYCATCDGFFFRGKRVFVVGGGDSALQEGLFLTKFASEVQIVHRRDTLRAGPALTERAFKNEKMKFAWDTVVTSVNGNGKVSSVTLQNVKTGGRSDEPVDGVFIYIGHFPNTQIFQGQLAMDEEGYLIVDNRLHTEIPGVFAAGEAHDRIFRQAITSAGFGCMAALEVEKYLAERGLS